jgi:diphosphomevalonate decarboxylase
VSGIASTSKQAYSAEMPSNIALIKYMGKVLGVDKNRPTNSSLSLTLNHLVSRVEITAIAEQYDRWSTIESEEWIPTQLSDRGRKRYMTHFGFLKQKLNITGSYHIQSANNFPSDCGIASSASSFAALTQATYNLAQALNPKLDLSLAKLADLSRVGSGSSIRSFMSPLVLWNSDGISEIEIPFKNLHHKVVIVEKAKKAIGSSDAHERVTTSLLFEQRPQRAEKRLAELMNAFKVQDWRMAYEVTWAEFWDMHALFATSRPVFGYMNAASLKVLNHISDYWEKNNDGPLVTMDAGANVHLIYRDDQKSASIQIENELNDLFANSTTELRQV